MLSSPALSQWGLWVPLRCPRGEAGQRAGLRRRLPGAAPVRVSVVEAGAPLGVDAGPFGPVLEVHPETRELGIVTGPLCLPAGTRVFLEVSIAVGSFFPTLRIRTSCWATVLPASLISSHFAAAGRPWSPGPPTVTFLLFPAGLASILLGLDIL